MLLPICMILFAQRVGFGLLYGLLPVAVSSVLEFHLAAVSILEGGMGDRYPIVVETVP